MYLAVGTGDGEVSIWNAAQTAPICRIASSGDNRILDISWYDAGNLLFICGSNGLVYFAVFDKPVKQLSPQEFVSTVMQVRYSVSGKPSRPRRVQRSWPPLLTR